MTLHVIAIVGPTASGKTQLGVEAAHRCGSEIVSADSRQVYRGLDIGTGKDLEEYSRVKPPVPVHLIDVADPMEVYTLFRYQEDCYKLFREFSDRDPFRDGKTPVLLVGGSGLYVEAVVCDYRIADVPVDPAFRAGLEKTPHAALVERLQKSAPTIAEETDLSTTRRVIRGLEIAEFGKTHPIPMSSPPGMDLRFTLFAIEVERRHLKGRIRRRLHQRLDEGMIDEVRRLVDRGVHWERLTALGLEYREIGAFLRGEKSRDRMVRDLQRAIFRFAKRQQTWFRGMERRGVPLRWIGVDDVGAVVDAAEIGG